MVVHGAWRRLLSSLQLVDYMAASFDVVPILERQAGAVLSSLATRLAADSDKGVIGIGCLFDDESLTSGIVRLFAFVEQSEDPCTVHLDQTVARALGRTAGAVQLPRIARSAVTFRVIAEGELGREVSESLGHGGSCASSPQPQHDHSAVLSYDSRLKTVARGAMTGAVERSVVYVHDLFERDARLREMVLADRGGICYCVRSQSSEEYSAVRAWGGLGTDAAMVREAVAQRPRSLPSDRTHET